MRFSLLTGVLLVLTPAAPAQSQLWGQGIDGYSQIQSSISTSPNFDQEAADDFDIQGLISRVRVGGGLCFGCTGPDIEGVWVRFWEWNSGSVGALLQEQYLASDDPDFTFDELNPAVLDIRLPNPFPATGKHFLSVQLDVDGFSGWRWWTASDGQTLLSPLHWRDNLLGTDFAPYEFWSPTIERDLAFDLWGEGTGFPPPTPELVWAQNASSQSDTIPAGVTSGAALGPEVADDFEFNGDIYSLLQQTRVCYQCPYPTPTGGRIRFYAWTPQGPGALLYDEVVEAGADGVDFQGLTTVTQLPTPFHATGKHFFSVQLFTTAPSGYELKTTGEAPDKLLRAYYRESDSSAWGAYHDGTDPFEGDTGFWVYGDPDPAPPVLPSGDSCGPWKSLPVPTAADTAHSVLRDVKVFAHDDVWAAGTILHQGALPSDLTSGTVSLHFDGQQWNQVDTPSPEPYAGAGGAGLWAIEGVAPDDLWAAGSQRKTGAGGFVGTQTLTLHWDGSGWTEVDSPLTPGVPGSLQGTTGGLVRGIAAIASDDVWFVGDWSVPFGCRMSLAMHWDGSAFTVYDTPCDGLPSPNGGFGLEAVSAAGTDDVWAVGGSGDGDFSLTGPYVIHWDGNEWVHVDSPQPGDTRRLFDVVAIASDDVWAVGQYTDFDGYHSYSIHWDGSSWTEFPMLGGSLGVWAASASEVYAVGGGVFRWSGSEWEFVDDIGQLAGDQLDVALASVDGSGSCTVYAVGRHVPLGTILPFAARAVIPTYWDFEVRNGCVSYTLEGGLDLVDPPALGSECTVAMNDPNATTGLLSGSTFGAWLVTLAPGGTHPCGFEVAGFGPGSASGELLVSTAGGWILVPGSGAWSGPQQPITASLPVPSNPALAGVYVFTQAVLFDGNDAVVTNALDLRLGL